ncbi:hypothetical protein Ahy_B03g065186 [Arachis hypogaea]|uniref:GRF-type domain-containing protein n=1 Tax=Arachis hypogaea TaxID=3818 RepID=A0A445A0Z5_ARAHY|nr:hypothetical protein Ahy_B03g065186 [Arachis hypogaea]
MSSITTLVLPSNRPLSWLTSSDVYREVPGWLRSTCTMGLLTRMETGNGCRSGGVSLRSHESNGSSGSMRMRRKSHEEACFCGLKAMIKKSGTAENPDRLFYTCSRYRVRCFESVEVFPSSSVLLGVIHCILKDNHCNYFKWVDGDDYEAVVEAGAKEDSKTEGGFQESELGFS